MKFLIWMRNVTVARHFFILVTFAIGLMCLYLYTFIFGAEKLNLSFAAFFGIISLFFLHIVWILVSAIIHFMNYEKKPAIAKGIFCVIYVFIIYFIYAFSSIVFYGN
jgi:hypothetical protein